MSTFGECWMRVATQRFVDMIGWSHVRPSWRTLVLMHPCSQTNKRHSKVLQAMCAPKVDTEFHLHWNLKVVRSCQVLWKRMWLGSLVIPHPCCCHSMLKQHWVWWRTWQHPHAHLVGMDPPWSCTEPRIQDFCVFALARVWSVCRSNKHQRRSGSWEPLTTWHMSAPLLAPWPLLDSKCWSTLQGRTFALLWMLTATIHQRATWRDFARTLVWVTGKSLWSTPWSLETLIMTRVWGVTLELTLTSWQGLCAMIGRCRSCMLWWGESSRQLMTTSQLQW